MVATPLSADVRVFSIFDRSYSPYVDIVFGFETSTLICLVLLVVFRCHRAMVKYRWCLTVNISTVYAFDLIMVLWKPEALPHGCIVSSKVSFLMSLAQLCCPQNNSLDDMKSNGRFLFLYGFLKD